jgi:hypothetical protein
MPNWLRLPIVLIIYRVFLYVLLQLRVKIRYPDLGFAFAAYCVWFTYAWLALYVIHFLLLICMGFCMHMHPILDIIYRVQVTIDRLLWDIWALFPTFLAYNTGVYDLPLLDFLIYVYAKGRFSWVGVCV